MTCDDCLTLLATADLDEVETSAPVRAHCTTCEQCARVVRLVAEEERALGLALDATMSPVPASVTAATASARARRRRTARVVMAGFAVVLLVTLWVLWARFIVPSMRTTAHVIAGDQITETLTLRCLTPEQAGDLISPYVRSNGSAYYQGKAPLRVITVRASRAELTRVHGLLEQFDGRPGAPCAVPDAVRGPTPR
jgi:hypothetical protein